MSKVNAKTGKMDSIQSLRAIAFVGIVSQHSGVLPLGAWGVSIFIVLSGFIMAYTYYNREIEVSIISNILFSLKKIKKLYVLHIIMIGAVVVWCLLKNDFVVTVTSLLKTVKEVILAIFLLQAWVPHSKYYYLLNGVAWYLCVCAFLYFVFPWIIKCLRVKSTRYLINLAVIVYIVFFIIGLGTTFCNVPANYSDDFSKWVTYICPLYRVGDFIIGCCIGCLYKNNEILFTRKIASAIELLVFALTFASIIYFFKQMLASANSWLIYSILFTPTSIAIVLLFACNNGIVTRLMTNRLTVYLGNISSYGFLIHQVIIKYFDFYFIEFNKYAKVILILILTVIASELYMRIEKICKKGFSGYLYR